jgi:hypothetical protein
LRQISGRCEAGIFDRYSRAESISIWIFSFYYTDDIHIDAELPPRRRLNFAESSVGDLRGDGSGTCCPTSGTGGPSGKYHRENKAEETPITKAQLVLSDYGRIFPRAGRIFSSLCGAPLLTEIAILCILGLVTIGLIWAGIGLILLGDYYRRYENNVWQWPIFFDRPILSGSAGLALGVILYVCWIVLSQTFSRCA